MERNVSKEDEALDAATPDRSLRALLLLDAIAQSDSPLSLAQLSHRLDTPKATLLRMEQSKTLPMASGSGDGIVTETTPKQPLNTSWPRYLISLPSATYVREEQSF